MKSVILAFMTLFAWGALAQVGGGGTTGDATFAIDAVYGKSTAAASELNKAQQGFEWNNTTPVTGDLGKPAYFGFGLGYHAFSFAWLRLRYDMMKATSDKTAIPATTASVTDSFEYQPLTLLLDIPVPLDESLTLGFNFGIGRAMKYEFHQKIEGGEDVVWRSNPILFRLGTSLTYMFSSFAGLFFETYYEQVTATLRAAQDYSTTIGGNAIRAGDVWRNYLTGGSAHVDMSGLHYGLGLRMQF